MSQNCNPLSNKEYDESYYQHGYISLVVARDKGSHEFRLENRISHYLVKLRLIEGNNKKCDYLILDCDAKNAYFIELKGQNLKDATKQIESTLLAFGDRLKTFHFLIRIVQTKVIKATFQTDKELLLKHLTQKYKANICDVKASDLVKIESQKLIEIIN